MSVDNSGNIDIFEQVIHKIPGSSTQFKKDKQGYVDLPSKNKSDLQEMIERQNKLVNNKSFINRLPDKGEKIMKYKNQLEEELKCREKADDLSSMLVKLNINGKEAIDKLEWNGNCNPGSCKFDQDLQDVVVDEDEKTDPLKIFATHSGTTYNQKITRVESSEVAVISSSVIEQLEKSPKSEIKNMDEQLRKEEVYIKHLCDKFDRLGNSTTNTDKFLPFRTLNHHTDPVTSKCNEDKKVRKTRWEVTAATPPPPVYNDAMLITLDDSLKLQIQQAEKLKEVQLKHATERLRNMTGKIAGCSNLKFIGKSAELRNPHPQIDSSDNSENDDDSYHSCNEEDDEPDEKGGTVTIYNLIDD